MNPGRDAKSPWFNPINHWEFSHVWPSLFAPLTIILTENCVFPIQVHTSPWLFSLISESDCWSLWSLMTCLAFAFSGVMLLYGFSVVLMKRNICSHYLILQVLIIRMKEVIVQLQGCCISTVTFSSFFCPHFGPPDGRLRPRKALVMPLMDMT